MTTDTLLTRALAFDFLTIEEGVFLYENATTTELMFDGTKFLHQCKTSINKISKFVT